MQSIKLQTEESKGSESRSTATAQLLTAVGVSVKDRSQRTQPLDRNLVSAGGTDDEDMEVEETGLDDGSAQARNIRDPGQPTVKEHQEHVTTHRPYRSWCQLCVIGRGVNSPHRRSEPHDDLEGEPHVSINGLQVSRRE